MNVLVSIADAAVQQLNAGNFSQEFTATRSYRPYFSPADLNTLHVTVAPTTLKSTILNRSSTLIEAIVDIGVQQHIPPDSDTGQVPQGTVDNLMSLCQEIQAAFEFQALSAMPSAMWGKTEFIPVYSFEHLDVQHIFTSVIRLTYKVGG